MNNKMVLWALVLCMGIAPLWGQRAVSDVSTQVLVHLRPNYSVEQLMQALLQHDLSQHYLRPLAPAWGYHLWQSTEPKHLCRVLRQLEGVVTCQPDALVQGRSKPNDAQYNRQWALDSIGAMSAWQYSTGGTNGAGDSIVCAVIDGSFDVTHEDLAPNLWYNRTEIPNNGLDDDQNGYIDDYTGWQVVMNTDRHDYGNLSNHGTAVLGLIGARGNNGLGIAGLNWHTRLLLVSAHTAQDITALSNVVEAYYYIWEQRRRYDTSQGSEGAYVVAVNASWGIDLAKAEDHPIWCALYDTLGQAGILSIASTTNRAVDIDQSGDMPCTCPSPYLVAVGESLVREERAGGYGRTHLDLFAPGGSRSTRWGDRYGDFGGTSAAAPQVSGAVALLYSYPHPRWAAMQRETPSAAALFVKDLLLREVVRHSDFSPSVSRGRLHLGRAMQGLVNYFEAAEQDALLTLYPIPTGDWLTLVTATQQAGTQRLDLYNSAGQLVTQHQYEQAHAGQRQWTIFVGQLAPGVYHARWQLGATTKVQSFVKMP